MGKKQVNAQYEINTRKQHEKETWGKQHDGRNTETKHWEETRERNNVHETWERNMIKQHQKGNTGKKHRGRNN